MASINLLDPAQKDSFTGEYYVIHTAWVRRNGRRETISASCLGTFGTYKEAAKACGEHHDLIRQMGLRNEEVTIADQRFIDWILSYAAKRR